MNKKPPLNQRYSCSIGADGLHLISFLPFQLSACGQEINANQDVDSGPASSIESSAATPDEPVLAKDASDILTRMTDFIAAAPSFSLVSETGHEVMQNNGQMLEFGSLCLPFNRLP